MFSKTNVTLETCTSELAREFAAMPGLMGERPLTPSRLAFLNNLRRTGRFASPTWAVVVDQATQTRYRANGQHSSTMLADLPPEEFPTGLLVTIEEYTTDNFREDAFQIFNIFDHPRSARTNTDVMGLHRAQYEALAGVDLHTLVGLCNGIAFHEAHREGGQVWSPRERGAYLENDTIREFVLWAAEFKPAKHAWMLGKAGIVAEMFSTFTADQAAAREFWRLVLTESHPDVEHETRELSTTLKDWTMRPRIKQDRFRREVARNWRRYHRSLIPVAA
jgi:hypothetical protein